METKEYRPRAGSSAYSQHVPHRQKHALTKARHPPPPPSRCTARILLPVCVCMCVYVCVLGSRRSTGIDLKSNECCSELKGAMLYWQFVGLMCWIDLLSR